MELTRLTRTNSSLGGTVAHDVVVGNAFRLSEMTFASTFLMKSGQHLAGSLGMAFISWYPVLISFNNTWYVFHKSGLPALEGYGYSSQPGAIRQRKGHERPSCRRPAAGSSFCLMTRSALAPPMMTLGLAGIVPQALCLVAVVAIPSARWFAVAAGCCYAAVILSFLGGLWWMAALIGGRRDPGSYLLAVMPSLVGWAALLPWCFGWRWPTPSLIVLAACLVASPLVDRALPSAASLPPAWLRLRGVMAGGLGIMTLALAFV